MTQEGEAWPTYTDRETDMAGSLRETELQAEKKKKKTSKREYERKEEEKKQMIERGETRARDRAGENVISI